MNSDFVMNGTCHGGASEYYMSRYPFYQLDINGQLPAAECRAVALRIADLTARVAGNNSSAMK